MASPDYGSFGLTQDRLVNAMTTGYFWRLNSDRTVDWSISKGPMDEEWSSIPLAVDYIGTALARFSYFANIKFSYVGAYVRPSVAAASGSEINFAWAGSAMPLFADPRVAGIGFFPIAGSAYLYPGEAGDVFFNTRSPVGYETNYAPGSAVFSLFIHEIGHALGLKHPHDDGGTGRPTLTQVGLGRDVDLTTVMSYNDDYPWDKIERDPVTPMILDVLALQYLYGKNIQTNAGDTTHSLRSTNYYGTLWDASGVDLVSVAEASEGWAIVLPNVQLSDLVDTKAGYAMPLGDFYSSNSPNTLFWLAGDMENAAGSMFGDVLQGSDARNALSGDGGNDYLAGLGSDDTINGGAGLDIAGYSGAASGFSLQRQSNGSFRLTDLGGAEGTDTLIGIERIQFSTSNVALDLGANQSAGQAVLLAGAVLPGLVALHPSQRALIGDVIELFDAGFPIRELSGSVLRLPIWDSLTGYISPSNTDIARYLLTNVLGRAPDQSTLATAVNALNTGAYHVQGEWLANLALSPENQARIGLAGVAESGLAFL